MLLQCVDAHNYDIEDDYENDAAEVICEIPSSPENTKSMPISTSVSVCINCMTFGNNVIIVYCIKANYRSDVFEFRA
jgi:hypothetical protein